MQRERGEGEGKGKGKGNDCHSKASKGEGCRNKARVTVIVFFT